MNEFWFKPHRYGFGASPRSWEGWAITLAYAAAVVGLAEWYNRRHHMPDGTFYTAVAVLSVALIFVAWLKTKGGWRWRWGDPD